MTYLHYLAEQSYKVAICALVFVVITGIKNSIGYSYGPDFDLQTMLIMGVSYVFVVALVRYILKR